MNLTTKNGLNYKRVLRTIWLNEGISRREIADLLGLDKSTITNITASLQKDGAIAETAEGEAGPQGGRRPIKLKIERNFCAAAGIDLQPEGCNIVCINTSGEILYSNRIPAQVDAAGFVAMFPDILGEIRAELDKLGVELAGAGLGLPGIVDPDRGVLLQSMPLGVSGEYGILEEITKTTDVPVLIDNNGNCCCWGELVFNRTEELQDFLYCLIEFAEQQAAIGMGIVIDGKVHYGRNFSAGEFKSIFAGDDKYTQILAAGGSPSDIRTDTLKFKDFAEELGRNLALLVNTFALSDCFVGGELDSEQTRMISGLLKKEFDRNWSYAGDSSCRIRTSSLGEKAVAYGAASMIIDRLFRIPDFRAQNSMEISL